LRNIDTRLKRLASETNSVSRQKREQSAAVSALKRRIGIAIAVVGLCASVAGCVSDMAAPAAENSGGSQQLRYYGGPKYPMWSAQ
jgi:hypothetical protein